MASEEFTARTASSMAARIVFHLIMISEPLGGPEVVVPAESVLARARSTRGRPSAAVPPVVGDGRPRLSLLGILRSP